MYSKNIKWTEDGAVYVGNKVYTAPNGVQYTRFRITKQAYDGLYLCEELFTPDLRYIPFIVKDAKNEVVPNSGLYTTLKDAMEAYELNKLNRPWM